MLPIREDRKIAKRRTQEVRLDARERGIADDGHPPARCAQSSHFPRQRGRAIGGEMDRIGACPEGDGQRFRHACLNTQHRDGSRTS